MRVSIVSPGSMFGSDIGKRDVKDDVLRLSSGMFLLLSSESEDEDEDEDELDSEEDEELLVLDWTLDGRRCVVFIFGDILGDRGVEVTLFTFGTAHFSTCTRGSLLLKRTKSLDFAVIQVVLDDKLDSVDMSLVHDKFDLLLITEFGRLCGCEAIPKACSNMEAATFISFALKVLFAAGGFPAFLFTDPLGLPLGLPVGVAGILKVIIISR